MGRISESISLWRIGHAGAREKRSVGARKWLRIRWGGTGSGTGLVLQTGRVAPGRSHAISAAVGYSAGPNMHQHNPAEPRRGTSMVPPAKRAVPSRSCEAGAACSSVPVIQSHGTDTVPRSTTFPLAHSSPPPVRHAVPTLCRAPTQPDRCGLQSRTPTPRLRCNPTLPSCGRGIFV